MRRLLAGAITAAAFAGAVATAPAAQASVTPKRIAAFAWAKRQAGCWYSYGGTSCSPGYDCSGLVMSAYSHAGISLPRTTTEMLRSRKLIRVRHPVKGDLAFFGTGHVELVQYKNRWTFGARNTGTRVQSYRNVYWRPTAYYRVRGAG